MTPKEIFIIKAIWGSDFQIAKKDTIKNANKSLNFPKKIGVKLKSELSSA